jgi:hypothetical protein
MWTVQKAFPKILRTGLILTAFFITAVILSPPALAKMEQYPGVVLKLDLGGSYLIVMNPRTGGRLRFSLTEETIVTEREEERAMSDLTPGTPVTVDYEQSGDRNVARHIFIQSGE